VQKLRRSRLQLIVLAASCVAIGAGISAITSAGAATSTAAAAHGGKAAGAHRRAKAGGARRAMRRAVHAQLVVATKSGFANISFDRGSVESVSGQRLTLREGTRTKTYQTVTLTIPANARVRINRKPATLSQLTAGQRVLVLQLPRRTVVSAHKAKTP
jgi:hypothetical protein